MRPVVNHLCNLLDAQERHSLAEIIDLNLWLDDEQERARVAKENRN